MNIPPLPTDNFYKFISLSGITLIITGVLLFNSRTESIKAETWKLKAENIKILAEITSLTAKNNILKKETDYLDELLDKYDSISVEPFSEKKFIDNLDLIQKDKNYRDYLEFIYKNENRLIPEIEIHQQIKDKTKEAEADLQKIEYNQKVYELHLAIIKDQFSDLITIAILTILMTVIGSSLASFGFTKWYKLVQAPSDNKLALEIDEMKKKFKAS